MNDVIPFFFDGCAEKIVRAVVLDNETNFVGKDVCDRLAYENANDAMKRHCKGVAKRYPLQTPGGVQHVRVLTIPDVLRLIMGSTLPEAVRFEKWVFEDVLPTILRTGSYARPGAEKLSPDPEVDRWLSFPTEERRERRHDALLYLKIYGPSAARWIAEREEMPRPPKRCLTAAVQHELDMNAAEQQPGVTITVNNVQAGGR